MTKREFKARGVLQDAKKENVTLRVEGEWITASLNASSDLLLAISTVVPELKVLLGETKAKGAQKKA